jgi:arginine decarboxylase
MDTPIVDFVKEYIENNGTRFHMPGHKGHVFFGLEPYDITEIKGADVLHHGDGIIAKSEKNASELFGSGRTHYSTEGSTHCIKAMLAILAMQRKDRKRRPYLLAARNVHRSMIDACALLDLDIHFMKHQSNSLCTCVISAEILKDALAKEDVLPLAVYVTTPDYLGQTTDISALALVCKQYDIPLVVDHAHGAYRHFLEEAKHPMDLGAAMCCDSAHKTLPVLTGGAYLHIGKEFTERFEPYASQAMALFGSTSPSYLIMQSLDLCNAYLDQSFRKEIHTLVKQIDKDKKALQEIGIPIEESEELKIVIHTAQCGYEGEEIAEEMRQFGIECEYADREHVVWMLSPQNEECDHSRMLHWAKKSVLVTKPKEPLRTEMYQIYGSKQVLTIREAVLAPSERINVTDASGRICAAETISCPPAIPIAISGEEITKEMIQAFQSFQLEKVSVVKE